MGLRESLWAALFLSFIGIVWNFRHLNQEGLEIDSLFGAGAPLILSATPRNVNFWERNDSSCFHFDSVCSSNGQWFYGPNRKRSATAHQPTVKLILNATQLIPSHGYDIEFEERIYFNVTSSSHQLYDDEACSFDPTPMHLIVQCAWNDMMGEFYSRIILGLNQWMRAFPPRSNDDVQTYIHFLDRRKQRIFEGHHLFLGGLPNNNKVDNFLSLMPNDDTCRCYTKLIFCGYSAGNATASSVNMTTVEQDEHITVFRPRGSITPKVSCDGGKSDHPSCNIYRNLRRDLIDTYSEKDPILGQKIQQYQREVLIQKGLISSNSSDVEEWKFVGLANRKYRRKWLNINDTISICDEKFTRYKIVCITVDVEEADSPEEQLLMHRSLSAFIGVHGAQLTQGVLLPRHGYILELLPWIPFYLWGAWAASVQKPTPLGIIFHNTDLNHVGYPLGRESVPLCLHVDSSDQERERRCFMDKKRNLQKFRWADRDFNVQLKVVEDFISTFLLKDNNSTCNDMQKRAEEKNFVLYNAFCQNETGDKYRAEHYYRESDTSQPKNIHEKWHR